MHNPLIRNDTSTDSIESLLAEAESFGRVNIGHFDEKAATPNCYACRITFSTIAATTLEARSDHFAHTFAGALRSAIANAHKIRAQFK